MHLCSTSLSSHQLWSLLPSHQPDVRSQLSALIRQFILRQAEAHSHYDQSGEEVRAVCEQLHLSFRVPVLGHRLLADSDRAQGHEAEVERVQEWPAVGAGEGDSSYCDVRCKQEERQEGRHCWWRWRRRHGLRWADWRGGCNCFGRLRWATVD